MDPRRPLTGFAELAERVRARRPGWARTRLVCVDGPAGSGKTTFAGRLAAALGAGTAVLHMDDLYAGWTLDGAVARLTAGVLRPLADGPARAPTTATTGPPARFAADADRRCRCPTVLVVEGCGSCPRALDRLDDAADLGGGAGRRCGWPAGWPATASACAAHWQRWQRAEAAEFAARGHPRAGRPAGRRRAPAPGRDRSRLLA